MRVILWLMELLLRREVTNAVERSHGRVDSEESDWDWSKSSDTNTDLNEVSAVIRQADVSLFLGEIKELVTRGFDTPQIVVLINKVEQLKNGQQWYVEFNVKAFDRGTPLNLFLHRLDFEHIGFIIQSDSALSFEIGNIASQYDQSDKEIGPPSSSAGLN